jgi:hypothetical protein
MRLDDVAVVSRPFGIREFLVVNIKLPVVLRIVSDSGSC